MNHKLAQIILIVLFLISTIIATDTIIMKNGDEISVKLIEISDNEVTYKKSDNLDGPQFKTNKNKIFMIKYENGNKEVFNATESNSSSTSSTNPGWTRGAMIMGYTCAIPILVLAIMADMADDGVGLGIAATAVGGITIPITAAGAGSGKNHPNVKGSPGLRIAGWILYGVTMADAVTLIGVGIAGGDLPGMPSLLGVMGGTASIFMALDAQRTNIQNREIVQRNTGSQMMLSPIFSVDRQNKSVTSGLQLTVQF